MTPSTQTATWPLDPERPELALIWFNDLKTATRHILSAAEAVAHAGVTVERSGAEVVAELERLKDGARFNACLASAMRDRRKKLGLSTSPMLDVVLRDLDEDFEQIVSDVTALGNFIAGVVQKASVY